MMFTGPQRQVSGAVMAAAEVSGYTVENPAFHRPLLAAHGYDSSLENIHVLDESWEDRYNLETEAIDAQIGRAHV